MTTRTRDWMKLGGLVVVALILALAFASAVDFPRRSLAQQPPVSLAVSRPASIPAARSAADLSSAFVAVVQAVRPAVVYIEADQRTEARPQSRRQQLPPPFDQLFPDAPNQQPRIRRGEGSGFIISKDGYILTNNHVVDEADRLKVRLYDKREFPAKVVGRDPDTDVAVIRIDATDLPTVALGNSDSTQVGEWALAVGNPLGSDFSFTVTAGIVSAKGRLLQGLRGGQQSYSIQDFIQTDAAINPGNSGGPLVNINGQVIGINSAIASPTGFYQGYGFAVPINLARTVAEQLIAHGKVTRAILGVSIRDADPDDAAYVGLDSIRGVVVQGYSPADDSPAKKAGVQPGDVIVALDGQSIEYVAQLQQIVGFKRPGEHVQVTVLRKGGERRTYTVTLGSRAEDTEEVARRPGADTAEKAPFESKLGLSVEPVTQEEATRDERIGSANVGLAITAVDPDGPAADKALGPQEIITHINGDRVRTLEDLRAALAKVKPGDIISLQLYVIPTAQSQIVRLRAGG